MIDNRQITMQEYGDLLYCWHLYGMNLGEGHHHNYCLLQ